MLWPKYNNIAGSPFSKALCGWGDYSWQYHLATFMGVWICSDFYEFLYHRLGHVDFRFWQQHKHHHVFYNPSPFSVIGTIPFRSFVIISILLFLTDLYNKTYGNKMIPRLNLNFSWRMGRSIHAFSSSLGYSNVDTCKHGCTFYAVWDDVLRVRSVPTLGIWTPKPICTQ